MLALLLFQASLTEMEPPARPGNLGQEIYYASANASGSRLCDRMKANHYGALFRERYGKRIATLIRYHVGRYGPDPPFIFTQSCERLTGTDLEQDRSFAAARARFDAKLRDLELRYGPDAKNSGTR